MLLKQPAMTSTSISTTPAKPHFSLLATSFAGGPRPRNAAIILAGLWLLLFFASLFTPPVLDDADATHAQAARAMASTGDMVTLHVDGVRYLEKAPLPYWLAALSFRIFGFNTFAAHLPLALAVALLALLGHRWANQAFGARTGFYTAIAILTAPGVFLFTRILIPEVLLSLLLGASLFAFLRAMQHAMPPAEVPEGTAQVLADPPERPSTIWYAGPWFYPYVMWATLALAVLAKGLVALVFFAATTLLFLLLTDTLRDWRRLRPFSGIALFLLIAAPWHVLAAMRNSGSADGHGFLWFYLWNEHVLRALGRRVPRDYNRMPGYLYWLQHLVWLFPWGLFLPLGVVALGSRQRHQTEVLTGHVRPSFKHWQRYVPACACGAIAGALKYLLGLDFVTSAIVFGGVAAAGQILRRRHRAGLPASPFHRIDAQQRSILLLSVFAGVVLLSFSLVTNQEYYTFPAYLPLLLLIAATITRAEQAYSSSLSSQRWIGFAHGALSVIGAVAAICLVHGLWVSRGLPYTRDIGTLLAHRGVGGYTLSLSHVFDLTSAAFASLRLPAVLAAVALLLGPALASTLRKQRRHIAATTSIAFTSAAFLFAAHIAFARFAPMLSSEDFAATIQRLERTGRMSPASEVMLFGDQAFGSSIPFYLGQPVKLVDGRTTSMFFGSTFPDSPPVFLTSADLLAGWGTRQRKVLFIPAERREEVTRLLGRRMTVTLVETSGKLLVTDRPLDP